MLVAIWVGCAAKPVRRVHFPVLTIPRGFELSDASANAEEPERWRGCEWDYDGWEPVTFEVWASTNLVDWVLATNTAAHKALFPPKKCEFYRVRTRDQFGQVSDWATVPKR